MTTVRIPPTLRAQADMRLAAAALHQRCKTRVQHGGSNFRPHPCPRLPRCKAAATNLPDFALHPRPDAEISDSSPEISAPSQPAPPLPARP